LWLSFGLWLNFEKPFNNSETKAKYGLTMKVYQNQKKTNFLTIFLVISVVASLLVGGWLGYFIGYSTLSDRINTMQEQLSTLQQQIQNLQSTYNATNQNTLYILGENVSLSQLYEQIKNSIVVVRGLLVQQDIFRRIYYAQVQGTGFIYNFTGETVVLTNYHVIAGTINVTVTFVNGHGYQASVLGSDPYADLAVLSTNAPQSEYDPLEIVSSSTLNVGEPVITVGNPYGLAGSMTTGIVSAMGRTITEETTGTFAIADVIQTTALLNPGNSGGPLLNYKGQVVGITTAIVSGSQGLSFAIPSDAILREIEALVTEGSYNKHPWLGVAGVDMTYEIAKAMNVNVTYGLLITQVSSKGPADNAGLRGGTRQVLVAGESVIIGGDVITAIDGTKITSMDDLLTYLEVHTVPGQTIDVTIVRNNQTMIVPVKIGTRPSPS
jgi:S1-C subfamily serine protease